MAEESKIEWTDATWNIITGCSVISPGCKRCYAMRLAGTRLKHHPSRQDLTIISAAGPVWNGQVRFNRVWLTQPSQWRVPRDVFVCAHGDLFHESVPDAWLVEIFGVMEQARHHRYQVLTKRSDRMQGFIRQRYGEDGAPPWIWLGVSIEDKGRIYRLDHLRETPAKVRFLSLEPLLGDLGDFDLTGTHWVIAGGESGPGARPMHPDWVRGVRDQCVAAKVPFFFKQWGEWGAPTDTLGALDWPYHKDHDRTFWFDQRVCVRPSADGWSDKYKDGAGALPPPPFNLFQTREFLDQVRECPQASCREHHKCMGNEGRAAATWRGKKKAGRELDGRTWDDMPRSSG